MMKTTKEQTNIWNDSIREYLASFETISYGIAALKNDQFSTLLQANSAFYKVIGYSEEQLLEIHQNHIAEILIDDICDRAEKHPEVVDFDNTFDLRIRTADKSVHWVHGFTRYDSQLDIFFLTVADITDKMITDTVNLSFEAFQARNAVLSYVSKYTTEHIAVVDVESDEIVYMNPSAMKMSGLQKESDWQGKTYTEIAFGSKENVHPQYYEALTDEFTSREYYNEFHKMYIHTKSKLIDIPNINRKMRLVIFSDITAQYKLEHKIAVQNVLHNCVESLFTVGVTDKSPDKAYFDILDLLKKYYQSDITFFYKFKDGTYEIEKIYEVFADGVEPSKHTFPITVPDHQMNLLQKLSDAQANEYQSLIKSLDINDTKSLRSLHAKHNVVDFSCVTVKDKDGRIAACMGVTNSKSHADDKELMHLLSRFICMFIEHQQDQNIKKEALSIEEHSKQTLVEKCIVNSQNLTHANESVTNTLDALCKHYDADFAVALLNQEDGYCITSYVGGHDIPNLDGLDNQPRHIMEQWVQVFSKYPEVVSDAELVDPIATMVKNILKEKYGINNFIVSPLKNSNGDVKGLLFVNNFKLLNRGRSMVHFVAESISSYLGKIGLYENTQLGLLTRLTNKKTIENQITQLLSEGKNGTLFVVDIDEFRKLNDAFGHHMGDQAIVDLADSLKNIFQSTDIIGRIGGDKFMVFSTTTISYDSVIAKAKQILAKCYHRYEKDGISMEISASIGICLVNGNYNKFQVLSENANYALYIAKKNGKHGYHIYTDAEYFADTAVEDDMQFYPNVVEKLQSAIHEHSFVVHYQPIYHVPTGTYTQAEALVRIAKPDGTLIYPNDFIEVAENSGLAVEMTYQILEQVCRDFRQILNNNPDTTLKSVAINVPYLQFTDPDMENRFLEVLKKYDIAPSQIKLEITERSVITDMELMLIRMARFKELGFEFELDDFGTNYSNLKMCVSLPLEIIKLDRSLLLAAMVSDADCRFFQHILSGLHDSGRRTVMEGVETQVQLDWATGCDCEYIQGYYFSKPVDFEAFSNLLLNEKIEVVIQTGANKTDKVKTHIKSYILDNEYLSISKHFIVTDIETDEIMYMSASAMKTSGLKQESDWKGKTYTEIGFGSKEYVRSSYYEPLNEDEFTVDEYYNQLHKKHIRTESKLITIPALNRTLRFTIINDITAQKKLERKMEAQNGLHHCIEALFTAGTTNKSSKDAYIDILNMLKGYHCADRAFFYKFKDGTYEVESFNQVYNDGLEKIEVPLPMTATEHQIKLMYEFSKSELVNAQDVLDSLEGNDKENLAQVYLKFGIETFACVTVTDRKGNVVAFIGVVNPQPFEDTRTLMQILSRYICMFIEHEHNEKAKDEALKLEAISKKNMIEICGKNFHDLSHPKELITNSLDALCEHYDADFAVIISRSEDTSYGVTHVGGNTLPDLGGLQQSSHFMKNWLETFEKHTEFASDLDFDDVNAPMVKKLLLDKFGIYNFVASPMRDTNGVLMGLLIVNNVNFTNRSHLLVHIVANDISDYLQKISMSEKNNLEPLSKLTNKIATQNQISTLLAAKKPGSMFIIDIDNFKCLNDTLGHQVGDLAIVDFANKLKELFRGTDIIGRVGGDEFMVFCPMLTSKELINKKAELILEKCDLQYEKDGQSVRISASVGICCANDNCNTFQALYEKADRALYMSKLNGKNQYNIYITSGENN